MKERRGFVRVQTNHLLAETVMQVSVQGKLSHRKIKATIENLSADGVLLCTMEKLPLDAHIIMNIPLTDNQFACCKAIVVRRDVHDHLHAYGCHCIYITEQDREKLEQFVYRLSLQNG